MTNWIRVEDGLPEFGVRVLVFGESEKISVCELSEVRTRKERVSHDWIEGRSFDDYMYVVTHWMPLPEPPTV